MNFIQKIATGRLFFRKSDPATKSSRIPDLVAKFTFMEKTYILENFDIGFTQEVNEKGRPGGLPHGGIITLTISETPEAGINEWMMREKQLRDGEIRIFPNKSKVNESSVLHLTFKDAYCIRYKKQIDALGGGLRTTLVISPRYIKIGGEEFENNWKVDESLPYYIRSN
ncbi:MAG: hypothetical protein LBH12_06595 [Dysgonamonadaceae bacterium]|jgi:hypothetical protein|nr:hypothetical protein [Dysgonamonadaceae bacterium]